MASVFQAADWDTYKMDYKQPHLQIEPEEQEVAVVDGALQALLGQKMLPHLGYDNALFLAHRQAVAEHFEIPWTAITPRMQRFLYALNAITQPAVMIAAGIFCGNTFMSNAGAGAGPGASYEARQLIGIEIKPEEAARAERNVRKVDPTGVAFIVAADAVPFVAGFGDQINLLYLDADGSGGRGKSIYLEILEKALPKMPKGSLVLAHNSVNCADQMKDYLAFVRDHEHMADSVNVITDPEGLEVSTV